MAGERSTASTGLCTRDSRGTDPQTDTDDAHGRWTLNNECQTIVANVPLVSVDLVIERGGDMSFGKHENEPTKGVGRARRHGTQKRISD